VHVLTGPAPTRQPARGCGVVSPLVATVHLLAPTDRPRQSWRCCTAGWSPTRSGGCPSRHPLRHLPRPSLVNSWPLLDLPDSALRLVLIDCRGSYVVQRLRHV
jgi:hypothetical protein